MVFLAEAGAYKEEDSKSSKSIYSQLFILFSCVGGRGGGLATCTEEDLFVLGLTQCLGRDLGECRCWRAGGESESHESEDEVCGDLWCLRGFLFFGLGGLLERSEPDETSKELSDGLHLEADFEAGFERGFFATGLGE